MASYVTVAELKAVLGVEDLYPDADLQDVCDTASNILDKYLTYKAVSINAAALPDHNVQTAYYWTSTQPPFSVGESVTISSYYGAPFTGTQTVTAVGDYSFQTSKNHGSDHPKVTLIPTGRAVTASQTAMYETVAEIRMAALLLAEDVWSARQSPAGQAQGVDFQPGPYRMGRSMLARVIGLIGVHRDVNGMIG